MNEKIEFNIDGFDRMYKVTRKIFADNLLAIFVHGSLFDGTFGQLSDFDIVIVTKKMTDDVLERDLFAQKMKKNLSQLWTDNPFSFDFFTEKELFTSAENGHPFVRSILRKGSPVYDPKALFSLAKYRLRNGMSKSMKNQMYKNLIFLARARYNAAKKLYLDNELNNLSLTEANSALILLVRAKLIKKNKNIYKGELYQFFLREYKNKLDVKTERLIWKYGLHANQIVSRLNEPHVDIPLQNSSSNHLKISNFKYTKKLLDLYDLIVPL